MICQAMGVRWSTSGTHLLFFAILILVLDIQGCRSLNFEGLALLEFRTRVVSDPYGVLANWNPNDNDPCLWSGVCCVDSKVQMLHLNGLALEGELAPELGKLIHLRSLVLCNNHFFGVIPEEIEGLKMLEILDLRNNNLSGTIPAEIGGLESLRSLLLRNNNFQGDIPPEVGKLSLLSELQFDENIGFSVSGGIGCINRKFGHCIVRSTMKQLKKADSSRIPFKETLNLNALPFFKSGKESSHRFAYNCSDRHPGANQMHEVRSVKNLVNIIRRRLLQASNLAASPASRGSPPEQVIALPSTRSSGSFPAVPNGMKGHTNKTAPSPADHLPESNHNTSNPVSQSSGSPENQTDQKAPSGGTSWNTWKYIVAALGVVVLLIVATGLFIMCRNRQVANIGPWKTGLSGQLQKAFITGVPKLNRAELETACEDFSNIIFTVNGYTVYKGTLSSGVEIAVASLGISSHKDWSKHAELAYRKKIDTLSRVNHKNFVNLIGFCEEEQPFTRMMVFEYAPNGSLSEHLHVKEQEHLDWNARMRIIMGTAYCLQYMHDLDPPVSHSNLTSGSIFLTDDYAAKIAFTGVSPELRILVENDLEHSELPPCPVPELNVYSFGVLMLEIISGKLPNSEEQGHLVDWAAKYLNDKKSIHCMIDPTLKSSKSNELEIICEVVQDCIQHDPRKRPTMKEVTSRLREVIAISPDAATPRLSPLWWAELEILSAEAA